MWAYFEHAEAPTGPLPAIPAAGPGEVTEETGERPGAAARPGPAAVPVAQSLAAPAAVPAVESLVAPAAVPAAESLVAPAAVPAAEAPAVPAVPAAEPPAVPALRAPAERRSAQPAYPGAQTAGPGQKTAGREEVPAHQENAQASPGRAQPQEATGLVGRPGESRPWAPLEPPPAAPPQSPLPKPAPPMPTPPKSASSPPVTPPPVPPRPAPVKPPAPPPEPTWEPVRARWSRGLKVAVALAVLLALAASLATLLIWLRGRAPVSAPTAGPSASAAPTTAAQVRAAAAAWVASQVSRATPISCDPVMCRALRADGVPAADLLVLRPGRAADAVQSRVIVVTPAVTTTVGTRILTADAPAAIASFGSGSRQISVRVIYPQGAAAYNAALREDIADRKANESTMLENPKVTALPSARRQLQGGQVDSRLLLTLAQLASQWQLSIVAFGDRAPGASPGIPLRSADLAVTGDVAGRARQMAAFAHQLQGSFAGARIRAVRLANGQDVVQVEFAAPSPLGLLNK
jgi:hypothetical protein